MITRMLKWASLHMSSVAQKVIEIRAKNLTNSEIKSPMLYIIRHDNSGHKLKPTYGIAHLQLN